MKNKNALFFIIILLVAVTIWQYSNIMQLQSNFLNLQICIIEEIPID